MLFGMRKKSVSRSEIPQNKESLFLFDNYNEMVKKTGRPTLITEAIFNPLVRELPIIKRLMK